MIQPIFSSSVAGLSFANPDLSEVSAEDEVTLVREPHNPYDPNAICVRHLIAGKLGYIPADSTLPLHTAWANGLTVKAKISGIKEGKKFPVVMLLVTVEI